MNKALEHLKDYCLELGMGIEPEDLLAALEKAEFLHSEVITNMWSYCVIFIVCCVMDMNIGYNVMTYNGVVVHFYAATVREVELKTLYVSVG